MAKAKTPTYISTQSTTDPLSKATSKGNSHKKPTLPQGKGVGVTTPVVTAPVIPYVINHLPTWTNSQGSSPAYSQTTDKGYDVIAMRLNKVRRELALAYANGVLSTGSDQNKDSKMPFFVTGVSIDWSLSGSIAQSRLTRDFYPHNFTQPSFTVKGISLNQFDYGEMVEFIHKAQHDALNGNNLGNLIQLNIYSSPGALNGGRSETVHGSPRRGVRSNSKIPAVGTHNRPNQMLRGHHEPITCQGYVGSIQRIHQKGVFVPTWQFSFTVAHMLEGPYKETTANMRRQINWTDELKGKSLFNSTWYEQNDKATLDWVLQESQHIFDVTERAKTSSTSSSSSSTASGTGDWWEVKVSQEASYGGVDGWTELSTNGNGAAAAGGSQSPQCTGNSISACDYATLGKAFPNGTKLRITNPSNGKTGVFPKVDSGNGSSYAPAIGITQSLTGTLGWSGENQKLRIQLADGSPLSVPSGWGKLIAGSSGGGGPATAVMTKLLAYAKSHSTFGEDGLCLTHVERFMVAVGYPGGTHGVGHPYAWNFGTDAKAHASAWGLKVLQSGDPYDAPPGGIVVVPHPNPGTASPGGGGPGEAGDIAVASGTGQFYNGGSNSYGGKGAVKNAILLAPADYAGG